MDEEEEGKTGLLSKRTGVRNRWQEFLFAIDGQYICY